MLSKYDKSKKYLLACSGGPDSMALLNMLLEEHFDIIVAHVNYKTREESDSEEALVRTFCASHNIPSFVSIFDLKYKGSFEDAARRFRYSFFEKVYFENHCEGLFVAHHKDDLLETYLLKKERNVINESFLILPKTTINNMTVLRPMLHTYYKEDLLNYCLIKHIPYGIDKTNFMDITPRNIIRKQLVNEDKEKLYQIALNDENDLILTRKEVKEFIKYYPVYTTTLLKDKSDFWLSIFLFESCDKRYQSKINKSTLLNLKNFLDSNKPNLNYKIMNNYYLSKNYNVISYKYIDEEVVNFEYKLDKIEYISTPYFKLKDSGLKMQGIFISEDEFPITIRNYKADDKIKLKEGYKKVSRLFIDKKVPLEERKLVPIILNREQEVIFVYNLYRKYGLKYIKNNLFMLK